MFKILSETFIQLQLCNLIPNRNAQLNSKHNKNSNRFVLCLYIFVNIYEVAIKNKFLR